MECVPFLGKRQDGVLFQKYLAGTVPFYLFRDLERFAMLRLDLAKILPRRSVISCKAFKISHDSKKQIVDWIKQSFGDDVGYGSFVEVDQNLCNEIASMEDLAHSGKAMANYIL